MRKKAKFFASCFSSLFGLGITLIRKQVINFLRKLVTNYSYYKIGAVHEDKKELCLKFPAVLKEKLLNNEIELPDTAMFDYEKILTYRAVERKADDRHKVTLEDFKSYYELNKKPITPRGAKKDFTKVPDYYGVSSFLKKEIVEQKMKFPNPNKKMAVGYVYKEGGPQKTTEETDHVCWWLRRSPPAP